MYICIIPVYIYIYIYIYTVGGNGSKILGSVPYHSMPSHAMPHRTTLYHTMILGVMCIAPHPTASDRTRSTAENGGRKPRLGPASAEARRAVSPASPSAAPRPAPSGLSLGYTCEDEGALGEGRRGEREAAREGQGRGGGRSGSKGRGGQTAGSRRFLWGVGPNKGRWRVAMERRRA